MKRQAKKLRRIIRVQDQLQRAAEWALHDLRREAAALEARQASILDALGRDNALLLGLAPALTARLSELRSHSDKMEGAREHQTDLVIEQRRRRMQAEKMEQHLLRKLRRAEDNAQFEEISGSEAVRVSKWPGGN